MLSYNKKDNGFEKTFLNSVPACVCHPRMFLSEIQWVLEGGFPIKHSEMTGSRKS